MLGKRGPRRGLFEADTLYGDFVGRDTFYGFLAGQRGELFRDEDFAGLYVPDNGRPSVPPSLLATALVLQTYDGVSDDEAKQRAAYDLRWKVALGVGLEERPFAKSTLQEFRAQLIVHREQAAIFRKSLELAKRRGKFRRRDGEARNLKVALDTTDILGRGAVKDTYNLLADGIVKLARVLARRAGQPLADWAEQAGVGRYVSGPSLKGQAAIDWSDAAARRRVLGEIVADADRLLELARAARAGLEAGSADETALIEAAGLLGRVLLQDVERRDDGPALKEGVAADRLVSLHDPEMRHGRKSARKRFDGHKAAVATDTDSQLIAAVAVLPGNAQDHERALALVEQSEANTGCTVAEAHADGAYGDGETRQAFADAGRELIAKAPTDGATGQFPKSAFRLDLAAGTCGCPGGQHSTDLRPLKWGGAIFHFAAAVCGACPLRSQCVKGAGGRTIRVHPREGLLQAARARQASPAGRDDRTRRQVVEHRIARLVQLGIRQARYVGRTKTLFQLLLAAAVANLTLLANAVGEAGRAPVDPAGAAAGLTSALLATLLALWSLAGRPGSSSRSLALRLNPGVSNGCWQALPLPAAAKMPGFRPGF
jgi:transposase